MHRRLAGTVPLGLALVIYLALSWATVRAVGVVGEVAIGWGLGAPPDALVSLDPPLWADGAREPSAGHRAGPLVLSQVRPLERLAIGPIDLPLAINRYTGGPPDWPALLVYRLTRSIGAVVALHVALGGLLIALVHGFVRRHAGAAPAAAAALVLATDWPFVFYRKVLGGTELALLFATLACLWGLWARRWTGGRHGLTLLGLGLGLGVLAKATFTLVFAALLLAALLMRWDKGGMRPPLPRRPWLALALAAALVTPLVLAAAHDAVVADVTTAVPSHDRGGLQWRRVLLALTGGPSPAREGLGNLQVWAMEPLRFFSVAYDAPAQPGGGGLRALGWALLACGAAIPWWRRHPSPRDALARFALVFGALQLGVLLVVARDLHHLAQTSVALAVVAGLAADQLAGLRAPLRSGRRVALALLLVLPLAGSGARELLRTDRVIEAIPVPTFTERGQRELVALLDAHGVERLVVADYESYGMLELRASGVQVEHAWPAVARDRRGALPAVLRHARGGHLLLVRASAPMVYNLGLSPSGLEEAAGEAGVRVEEVGRLADGSARLLAVGAGAR